MQNVVSDIQNLASHIQNEKPDVQNVILNIPDEIWNIRNLVRDVPNRICNLRNEGGRKPRQSVTARLAAPFIRNPQADFSRPSLPSRLIFLCSGNEVKKKIAGYQKDIW